LRYYLQILPIIDLYMVTVVVLFEPQFSNRIISEQGTTQSIDRLPLVA